MMPYQAEARCEALRLRCLEDMSDGDGDVIGCTVCGEEWCPNEGEPERHANGCLAAVPGSDR